MTAPLLRRVKIEVPDYWEIKGTNSSGSIHDKDKERGTWTVELSYKNSFGKTVRKKKKMKII